MHTFEGHILPPVGFFLLSSVSQRTSLLAPSRNGSGKMATGFRYTSESAPSAWPVDEPSKFHIGSSAMEKLTFAPLRTPVLPTCQRAPKNRPIAAQRANKWRKKRLDVAGRRTKDLFAEFSLTMRLFPVLLLTFCSKKRKPCES